MSDKILIDRIKEVSEDLHKLIQVLKDKLNTSNEDLFKMGFPVSNSGNIRLSRGKGCRECRGTGYRGRSGIFEIFPISSQIKKMVSDEAHTSEMSQVAIREGMTTLREDAWSKVRSGITTYEEALRVTTV